MAAVSITAATGGATLCYYSWSSLSNIVIRENLSTDFTATATAKTFILSAPKKYMFKRNTGTVGFVSSKDITSTTISITDTTIIVTIICPTTANNGDQITIGGIFVKPRMETPEALLDTIKRLQSNPGTYNIVGASFGIPSVKYVSFGKLTQASSLSYTEGAVTQTNFANINLGDNNNEILGINIAYSGFCKSVKSLTFELNTNGSTSPSSDISNAKLWFTGNLPAFTTAKLIGTFNNPNGSFSITGSDTVLPGINYFWITYDVPINATANNIVDAQCALVTISGTTYIPSPTTIAGGRTIGFTTIVSISSGNWNDPATWTGGIVPTSNNALIRAGHAITLTSNAQCVDLFVEGGSTKGGSLNLSSFEFTILGNINIDTVFPGTIISNSNSKLVVNDIGNKPTLVIPDGISSLQKLTINRATGATSNHSIDLSANVPADSIVLVLQAGVLLMTDGAILDLTSDRVKNDIPCSDLSYVDGPVKRSIVVNTGMKIFPVGNGGISRKYSVYGKTSEQTVQFFKQTPPNNQYYNDAYFPTGIWNKYYWKHDCLSGDNPGRRLFYSDSDFPGLTEIEKFNFLNVATNDCSTPTMIWDKIVGGGFTVDTINNWATSNPNSSNSIYWTFASTDAHAPLPIELLYFKAKSIDDKIEILWATASETNNDFFTIEKSHDGLNFNAVDFVKGAGNSNSIIYYKAEDIETFERTPVCYYRLKQTDYDGKFSYSDLIAVSKTESKPELSVYNDNGNIMVNIIQNGSSKSEIAVIDIMGRVLTKENVTLERGKTSLSFQTGLNKTSVFFVLLRNFETGEKTILKAL